MTATRAPLLLTALLFCSMSCVYAECPPGYYGEPNSVCGFCEIDTYKNTYGSGPCQQCPLHSSTGNVKGAEVCMCNAGYSGNGITTCTACTGGTFAVVGSSKCETCASGTYSRLAAVSCTRCPENTTTLQPGAFSVDQCQCADGFGNYEMNGYSELLYGACCSSPSCTDTVSPWSKVGNDVDACMALCDISVNNGSPCTRINTYNTATDSSCQLIYGNDPNWDLIWDSDEFGTCWAKGVGYTLTCTACTYPGQHPTSERGPCVYVPCGAGYSSRYSRTCEACAEDMYRPFVAVQGEACIPCPANHSTWEVTGAHSIEQCKLGCASGHYLSNELCVDCPSDTFQSEAAFTGSACVSCPELSSTQSTASTSIASCTCVPGTFARAWDASCQSCPPGTFQDQAGQDACKECPAGQRSFNGSLCIDCPPGTSSRNGSSTCVLCSAGWYQDQAGQEACLPCPPGTFNESRGSVECTACVAGSFSTTGATFCQTCNGTMLVTDGYEEWNYLPGYSVGLAYGCTHMCHVGYFVLDNRVDMEFGCRPCPVGQFQRANVHDKQSCEPCPANMVTEGDGAAECVCGVGFYPQHSTETCEPCKSGTVNFKSIVGNGSCMECAWPHFTSDGRACTCAAGFYYDEIYLRATELPCKTCPSAKRSYGGATSLDECVCDDARNLITCDPNADGCYVGCWCTSGTMQQGGECVFCSDEAACVQTFSSSSMRAQSMGIFLLALLHGVLLM